ncbi:MULTISPECIES: TolC family protein [Cupriavidus]|uniref:Cobalt-zinc-cadmium resistance protein CzcC n=3 Tax=Cupriavidus TaxID=106589 RepID=A0A375CRN6_9BURK|nr:MULTISPECIES: TolC family protein [Cupriavidus]MCO4865617.1 TolC family protein [Cupriavidus sp. WGlv3]MCO4893337.1 TolC family protein [Cupriavidus sp. WGtm5]ULX55963.1 cobalt-zinc-cadmium resistance protein [Cupriavidus taiwanensis]CAP64257.1 Cobalt-zinc-cadmium resistance protein, cation efflux system [Cupriavidus taiwanensis LMG 19424]SOY76583.1 Cobalt-zinc-cadmium resistance protein, cation efflux system [Cupriavidus taiwanensis]
MRRLFLQLGLAACALSPTLTLGQALPATTGAVAAQRDDAGPLTLETALALAAAGNFSLSAAAKEVDANEGAIMQSRVIPNPEIAAVMEDTRKATRTTTGQVNIPLELGGKRSARIAAAERGRDVAQAQLSSLRADLRASVIAAFFGVLIAQERVKLATGSADIAAKGAQAAARRVAAGKISPVDETKARVEQANAELEVAEATAELQTARQALATLWGNASPQFTEAVGDLDALPTRPAPDLLRAELERSPALLANRLELDRRQALVGVERSRQYPDLTLSVGAKRDNEANRNMAVLGVAIPLPLFDRNQGNLYEAIRRADKAQDEYLASQIRLNNALQQASNQLSVSRASAQALKTTVLPGAQQAYDAATKGFEAGKFNFLDVLDAQRTLFQARIRYLGVLARTYEAATNIDRILGR